MPAARQFCFLLSFVTLVALVASLSLPLLAQFQGVPAMEFHGVPSSGIGGTSAGFSAVRPNANLAGAAFGCCASFFFPSSFSPIVPYPSVGTGRRNHQHQHHHRRGDGLVGVAEPVYIPYAIPYAAESDDAADDQDYAGPVAAPAGGAATERLSASRGGKTGRSRISGNGVSEDPGGDDAEGNSGDVPGGDSAGEAAPIAPDAPVVAQPTTVLVFKDGHRSEVVNYAIVGDMLFDFSGGRTHKIPIADLDLPATQKANDASGVEFKLPPAGETSSAVKSGAN